MSLTALRISVAVVCVAGIAGMIVGSIADSNGVALTFGLLSAAATITLIFATAVRISPAPVVTLGRDEAQAELVEERVRALVAGGADELAVRELVRESVRLGEPSARRNVSR